MKKTNLPKMEKIVFVILFGEISEINYLQENSIWALPMEALPITFI
jgi:hypothetical protein